MILVDANLLIQAHMEGAGHRAARDWLESQLWGTARLGLPWPSLLAFVRLVTNPRAFTKPQTLELAWSQVTDWLSAEAAWIPGPTDAHSDVLGRLLASAGRGGNLVPDAHLAALSIEHGLTLCTRDAGFARFPGLTWMDPLQ